MEFYTYKLTPLLILIIIYIRSAEANKCDGRTADIVFVIDSSNSIWRPDFEKQLEFVKNIVDHFEIGENAVRVGALTFSHNIRLDFHLRHFTTKDSLKRAIMRIPFLGGATDTAKAIKYAREEMFKDINGGRDYSSHIIVVITDGYSVESKATAMEAHIARHQGIKLFAIGVGVSNNELNMIASKPNEAFVYTVNNFTGLNLIHENIANTACKQHTDEQNDQPKIEPKPNSVELNDQAEESISSKQYCGGKPADVYIVLDSSSSIWEPDFHQELNFTMQLINIFDISQEHTRVGVIEYSDGIHPVIPLDNGHDKNVLKNKISQLTRLTGGTNTGSVINYITEQAFARSIARPNVAHVAVILTDGQSLNPDVTAMEAEKAHAKGIYLFAIGIGAAADNNELNAIASDPDTNFVFRVDSFQALSSIVDILAIKTCEAKKNLEGQQSDVAVRSKTPTDIIFMYDSYSFGQRKSTAIRKGISKLLQGIDFHLGDIRMGVMSKVCQKEKDIKLSDYKNTSTLMYRSKSDGIDKLLRKIRHHGFGTKNGGRNEAKKVAIIFFDENVHHPHKVIRQARRTAFKIELYVINIGNKLSKDFLKSVCSSPSDEHLINISGYEYLPVALHKIIKRLYTNT